LSGAGLVAAEDTRRTVKILNHLGLKKTLLSYREENHRSAWPRLQKVLSEGAAIALLSDAGSPGVCDPGAALVREARGAGFAVWPVAGPSAVTAALSVCGFEASSFTFLGFLPPGPKARRERIKAAGASGEILVLFVPPHKQTRYLADLADILGPRPAFLAREMTKLHEEHLALPLPELRDELLSRPRKGEMTLVVGPAKKLGQRGRPLPEDGGGGDGPAPPDEAAVREAMDASSSTNEAARKLSQTGGVSKKDAYAMVLRLGAKLGRPAPDDDAEDDRRLEEEDGRLEEDDGRLEEDDD
jgi:16S rRNA (cytidine1402-2'-O)-methyltransferase